MASKHLRKIHTVDSHTEGNPTRVIVGGVPVPPGKTLYEKIAWLQNNDDALRRLLNFEPRGGGLMCSVLLMPPLQQPDAHFSIIIMEQDAYVPMCGHCAIGTATTIVAEGMIEVQEPITSVKLETPAGLVIADVSVSNGEPTSVTITNVESFLYKENIDIQTKRFGTLTIDIAYGGDFYPIIDADALGIPLEARNEAQILAAAIEIREAVMSQLDIQHPENPNINSCHQVQFISQSTHSGDIRNTVVAPPAAMDRSPCGTGTSALTAIAYTRNQLKLNNALKVEGPLGTFFCGKPIAAEKRKGIVFVRPQVTGRAFITGYHQFVLTPNDPFPTGFQVGHALS